MQFSTGIEHTTFTETTISGSIALSFEINQMNGPKKYYMIPDTDKRMIRTMEEKMLGSLPTNIFSYIAFPIAHD